MSEQKGSTVIHPNASSDPPIQEAKVIDASEGSQHHTKENRWKPLFRQHKKIGIVVIVVMIGMTGYLAYHYLTKPKPPADSILTVDPSNKRDNQKLIANSLKTDISGFSDMQKVIYYQDLASHYMTAKDYNNALATLKKAETIDPREPQTLATMGRAYSSLGQKSQAAEYYNKAIAEYQKSDLQDPSIQEKIDELRKLAAVP